MVHPLLPFLYTTMLLEHARGPPSGYCPLPASLTQEIESYRPLVRHILSLFNNGPLSGSTYSALADFADRFGHRIVGSTSLEAAIDHLVESLKAAGVDRVWTERVETPVWIRGKEEGTLVTPRRVKMDILGLGGSVATPAGGITARVTVVRSFEELDRRRTEVNGTIVLFNPPWTNYRDYSQYRYKGASRAARYGAVAALVRSGTARSLYTPHTGQMSYEPTAPKIPAATLTVEDADFLTRLAHREAATTPSQCEPAPVTGPCRASIWAWGYHTVNRTCQRFLYGGCGGNTNRFKNKVSCQVCCRGNWAERPACKAVVAETETSPETGRQ